ncbi:ATP-binding protein [Janibacter terrae]|uniref:ATP-binding protein n=1 Tax=Janibacter terrae TaxID=103817 RepID=UPI0031F93EB7
MDLRELGGREARSLLREDEGTFLDFKGTDISGRKVQQVASSFANSDGGEFYVGIRDKKDASGDSRWSGFKDQESANFVFSSLTREIQPAVPYQYEWLICPEINDSLVLRVQVFKSDDVHDTADKKTYVRKGASSIPIDAPARTALELSKGVRSYESQLLKSYSETELVAEPELRSYLHGINPVVDAQKFVRRERLVDQETGAVKVSAAVLFADNPSAISPRKCAVKVVRYETKGENAERRHLKGTPISIEGPAMQLIEESLRTVQDVIQSVNVVDTKGRPARMKYPPDALKEIVVNAVIHRDYNVSDDIKIFVFDNRVEVHSPGRLPGHMTVDNLLETRFSRNPVINRLINKYPEPPNQDIGEGLQTVLRSMAAAKLQPPSFAEVGTQFVVTLPHAPLKRPEALVLEYLEDHDEITNSIARDICGISSENSMKDVFYSLRSMGQLERVPGKGGNKAAWRKPRPKPSQRWQPKRVSRARRRQKNSPIKRRTA